MMRRTGLAALLALTTGCGDAVEEIPAACVGPLEIGDPLGHADPFGARAAGQARASRIENASLLIPPAHGRQPIRDGDFVLVNEHIAVVIEGARLSDGYGRFGGEIMAIDRVGEDGKPVGLSRYGETLLGLGLTTVNPASVTVLQDGSDGGEAIVRVEGTTLPIPFVAESLGPLFAQYSIGMAIDYVLAPGDEKVGVRYAVVNASPQPVDFGEGSIASDELYGFFHTNQNQVFTPEKGFGAGGPNDWVGFVSDDWSFAWRAVDGPLHYGLDVSGFYLFHAPGFVADGCAITTVDRSELFAGGPELDGLRETMRRSDGAEAWRAIEGMVADASGAPVADAWVHALDDDDLYVSRTKTGADGSFVIHTPPGELATLVAQRRGWPLAWHEVGATETSADIALADNGTIAIQAEDETGTALPVRIQVIPTTPVEGAPAAFGVSEERNGRLHQEFAITGQASLPVPPGEHRVIISRGYEYEIVDTTVTVAAGDTVTLPAVLAHSVDTSDVMCADFHIHSFLSADSSDPIIHKVKGAVADGLDIPVSSEHEWVLDFGPVVKELGLEQWAFGSSSSELTTFSWGHFGVVPLRPRAGALNNGAVDWVGRSPAEVFAAIDALEEQPALIVNHPRSAGIGGYFSAAKLENGQSSSELWSDNFDAIEVFNDSDFEENRKKTVADWFQLLSQGKRVVAIGNSDTHHLISSPAGYPRTCFHFGHDDPQQLSDLAIRDAVLGGDSVVSGGLYLTVSGPSGARPGATLSAGSASFSIVVQSPSWIGDASSLEVIVSGQTVDTVPLVPDATASPGKRYTATVERSLAAGDFVVFHVAAEGDLAPVHPGRRPFAVSNAIFVQ
jgi:hypothetical protein